MRTWNRALVAVIVAVALTEGAAVRGQVVAGAAQQTGAPPQAVPAVPSIPPSTWTFTAGAGMVFFQVKLAKAPAFEGAMARLKAALVASKDAVRKRQAQNWQVYKSTEPPTAPTDDNVLYIFVMPVTVADSDYDPLKILTDELPLEAQKLYETISASVSINRLGLKKLLDMGRPQ
jgi:hypothetical protein